LDPIHNFTAYRNNIKNCNPPLLPYLGVYLTDLIFVEDGNRGCNKDGLINFDKQRKLYQVIEQIERYQAMDYFPSNAYKSIPTNEAHIYTFLLELPHNDPNELYKISLVREPRGTESKTELL